MPTIAITIRPAHPSDIPALLSLLLTSFRQFNLFSVLYAPIDTNVDVARDTLFFWRRRLTLALLSPNCSVLVAEVDASAGMPKGEDEDGESETLKSARMLRWLRDQGVEQGEVVGFAIWKVRGVEDEEGEQGMGWGNWLRKKTIDFEMSFWRKVYARKDQDRARYEAYLVAEEELDEKYYQSPAYQLDNLAVDFRYQRCGIGARLTQWGLDKAKELKLDAMTEAGPMGEGLYKKLGFQELGRWKVLLPGVEDIIIPVLRCPVRSETTS